MPFKMNGPSLSKSGGLLCIFLRKFCIQSTIIRFCHTCSTWNSICHDNSSVNISKDHHLLDLWLLSSQFIVLRGGWISPLVWLRHNIRFKVSSPRSAIATFRCRNAWPSTLNLCFSNFAISRRFYFCSAVKQWGTHRAQFFFCKSFVKIRNTDVGEIPVACDISSHVAR
jgi:hypothetical protein